MLLPSKRCKIGIGTVQFGLDYGVANANGQTPEGEVRAILARGAEAGCLTIDTASAYGEAEVVLGRFLWKDAPFRIVTKTAPVNGTPIGAAVVAAFRESFLSSLRKLKRPAVYGLLAHHASDLLAPGGDRLYDVLRKFRDVGLVERIGASVYDRTQIDALVDAYDLDLVQLPVNVLDQRLLADGTLDRLHGRGIEIHARSTFLQGLLLMPLDRVPAYFAPIMALLRDWHDQAARQGMSLVEAALAFVRDLPQVDAVIIGVDSANQFEQVLHAASTAKAFDAAALACNDPAFVNPGQWGLS